MPRRRPRSTNRFLGEVWVSSEAKGGQTLTNQKTLSRIEDAVQTEPLGEVTLKGIAHPMLVFSITGFKV